MATKKKKEKKEDAGRLQCEPKHMYSFDCPPLDLSFGGGIPSGRIIEIFGWAHGGKSTAALEIIKSFQRYCKDNKIEKYEVRWLETESVFDRLRAASIGVDLNSVKIEEDMETIEQVDEFLRKLVKDRQEELDKGEDPTLTIIVWDTLAAVATQGELDGNSFGGGMAYKPRKLREMLRVCTQTFSRLDTSLIIINQMSRNMSNAEDESPGGEGVKFHCSIRTKVHQTKRITKITAKGQEFAVGYWADFHHRKNKITTPRQTASAYFDNEEGLDALETNLKYLASHDLVRTSGAWKTLTVPSTFGKGAKIDREIKFQNKKAVQGAINEEPRIKDYIEYLIYEKQCSFSTLTKVRNLYKLWDYEMVIFGKKMTTLTEKEEMLANIQYEELSSEDKKCKSK